MNDQQKRFSDEYLIDLNVTRAYKTAYPKVKKDAIACAGGHRLLNKPQVKTYLAARFKQLNEAKIASASEVMEYLTSVMRGESTSEIVVLEGQGEGYSLAKTLIKAPDEKERLKAAEMLGKRYQLFSETLNIEGTLTTIIIDDLEHGTKT